MSVDKLKTEFFSHAKHLSQRRIEKARIKLLSVSVVEKIINGKFFF